MPPSAGEQVGARVSSTRRAGSHSETDEPQVRHPEPVAAGADDLIGGPAGRLAPPIESPAMRIGKRQAQQMSVMSLPEKSPASGQLGSAAGSKAGRSASDRASSRASGRAAHQGAPSGGTSATRNTRPAAST